MERIGISFTGFDGVRCSGFIELPDTAPRATVVLFHGYGVHVESMSAVSSALLAAGYAVAGYDLRGHGKSEGKRGDIQSFGAFLEDTKQFVEAVRSHVSPSAPLYAYGFSMGGTIMLHYIMRTDPAVFSGAIAIGPLLVASARTFKIPLLEFLDRVITRIRRNTTVSFKGALPSFLFSHDAAQTVLRMRDPLSHTQMSARFYTELRRAGEWVSNNPNRFPRIPLLMVCAEKDYISSVAVNRRFAESVAEATFKVWPNDYHALHAERDRDAFLAYVIDWLQMIEEKQNRRV